MLEETLDDPPVSVSCHVTAVPAVPPHDDALPAHNTTSPAERAVVLISKAPQKQH